MNEPPSEQRPFGVDPDSGTVLRVAEAGVSARRLDRLSDLSESELARLARVVLASLATAEMAPLLARHEAGIVIARPSQVFDMLAPELSGLAQEQLRVLTLSTRHGLLGVHLIYQGTVSQSPVRPAEVLRPAVAQQAPAIIVVHNHPSGDPSPSADDHALTRQLAEASHLLGIKLVDHMVIGGDRYTSLREMGMMPEMPRPPQHLSGDAGGAYLVDDDRTGQS